MTVNELQQCIADYLNTGGSGADAAFVRAVSQDDDDLTAVTLHFKQVIGVSKSTVQMLRSSGGTVCCLTVDVDGE